MGYTIDMPLLTGNVFGFGDDPEYFRFRRNGTWRTKDGRTVPITNMGNTHLLHAIRYLEKTFFSDHFDFNEPDLLAYSREANQWEYLELGRKVKVRKFKIADWWGEICTQYPAYHQLCEEAVRRNLYDPPQPLHVVRNPEIGEGEEI